jgi:hypothetical protein
MLNLTEEPLALPLDGASVESRPLHDAILRTSASAGFSGIRLRIRRVMSLSMTA